MPKYLFHGSYTEEGLKGVLKEGGSKLFSVQWRLVMPQIETIFYLIFLFLELSALHLRKTSPRQIVALNPLDSCQAGA